MSSNPIEIVFPPNVYTTFADLTANQTFTGVNTFTQNIVGNLTGSSSLNVLKAGDTMTGGLVIQPTVDTLTGLVVNDKDTNNVLTVDTINNRIGIGTTSPTRTLSVNGQSQFLDNINLTTDKYFNFALGSSIRENTSGTLAFIGQLNGLFGANADFYVNGDIDASGTGNVYFGIGTLSASNIKFSIMNSGRVGKGTGQTYLDDGFVIKGTEDIKQLVIKGNATQTSNLTEWQNSSGTVLCLVNGLGGVTLNGQNAATTVQIGGATNNATFESDGTLVFNGTATVYDDVNTSFSGAKVPAANAPTWSTFNTDFEQYTFAVNDFLQMDGLEPEHGWKEGSVYEIHVHWATNGQEASDKYVKWEIKYTWANILSSGGTTAFTATATISTETLIPANTPTFTHMYTSVGTFTPTGGKIGQYLIMKVRRIASAGTAPAADPFGIAVGLHHEIARVGSRTTSAA